MEEYRDYIEHLKDLVKLEREEEKNRAIEDIMKFSGKQREKSGKAITEMKGKVIERNPKKTVIRFGRREEFRTDITMGDVVLVSIGDPLKKAFEGVVTGKGRKYIDVEFLGFPSINLEKVRIDLFYDDATFKRMLENLEKLKKLDYMH